MARDVKLIKKEEISELNRLFYNDDKAWDWFINEIVSDRIPMCSKHRAFKHIHKNGKYRYFACPTCKTKTSVLSDTKFSKTKIGLGITLLVCRYYWMKIPNKTIATLLFIDEDTVGYWGSVIRKTCAEIWNERQVSIGGEGKIVEIDEAIWRKRKFHRGRKKKQIWIFGGVERKEDGGAGGRFMVVVPNRKRETLIPLIQKYIKEGTTIMSDEWRAYDILETLGYKHLKVCHKRQFFNKDTGACTNTIEGLWHHLRCTFPSFGTRIRLMHDYLSLYLVKSSFNITFTELVKYLCMENDVDDEKEIEENEIEEEESEEIADIDDIFGEKVEGEKTESESDNGAGDGESASEYEP
ncbi:putative Uncharacterized transposase-like protein [Monocercomonoides exilis]|uniref:putative Uncharacterized transposase-like protein n=1 Tax=Monocercomonoides exilis TaxID=2049356 RepID=UPI003559B776|nr:putative Uncharacterized transposase-like protein [Monocercomonoides exilis]|eukprot:MONOS_14060.1-p1 / transcript=MONOS_14060.1 / gene=MONOS_14060 / organism=Monocercomonoides_exilis_PA203 / gene_product=Uncharacterized transposase-like protein HI1328.1 / transcript_product=Uncharacterized transposase-like protein HI1328.1 / location=Mono_scaffold00929:7461-8519(-) / protein_length=352 / sequence_SO=supercontig / SO=protein_coding / is_pseudo=false